MTVAELIELLRKEDPTGKEEVSIEYVHDDWIWEKPEIIQVYNRHTASCDSRPKIVISTRPKNYPGNWDDCA